MAFGKMQALFLIPEQKKFSRLQTDVHTAFSIRGIAPPGKIVYTRSSPGPSVLGSGCYITRKEVFPMLTVRGIITLVILVVLFALAVVWISKNGGWKGEGCGGNCASCHQRCETPKKSKDQTNN